ncbi:MAG: hypothetical protein AAF604_03030 [Acidobacteriota bacterium]
MRTITLRASTAFAAISIALLAPACLLNRTGIGWSTSVEPTIICPGDSVTVTWNAGPDGGCERNAEGVLMGSGCSDPTRVTITSTPDVFAADPIASAETAGTRVVNPSADTTFDFMASDRDDTLPSYSHSVDVITEDQVLNDGFGGACCGSTLCWIPISGSNPTLPATIRLVEVCNPNSFGIRLVVEANDGGISNFDLQAAGGDPDCTGELRNVSQITASASDPSLTAGAICSPTIQNPPAPIPVISTWRCPSP